LRKARVFASLVFSSVLALPLAAQEARAEREFDLGTQAVFTDLVSGTAGDLYLNTPPSGTAGVFLDAKTTTLPNVTARLATSTTASQFNVFSSANTNLFMVRGDGRVGVGTTGPLGRLGVVSTTDSQVGVHVSTSTTFEVGSASQGEVAVHGSAYEDVQTDAENPGYAIGGFFQAYNTGQGFLQDTYGLRVISGLQGETSGTVDRAYGIRLRITNPSTGSINTGYGIFIEDVTATNPYALYLAGTDDKSYFAGNVGIGATVSPTIKLDVSGAAQVYGAARRVARFWDSSSFGVGVGAGIDFLGKYNAAGSYTQFANVKGVKANATDGNFSGHLVLSVNNNTGGVVEMVRISETSMHVSGALTAANISATYQDVAEWVPTTQKLAPGTVVVLDAKAANHVVASTSPYDTTVAGVVSPQPGLILGVAGPSKAMIATTGRVKVRVDATQGPIAIGDLLVTGDKPGVAMKSKPVDLGGIAMHRPGTLIGKALEALDGGEGEILVLLSLQ